MHITKACLQVLQALFWLINISQMKRLLNLFVLFPILLLLFTACEDTGNDCPSGMYEQQLQDGSSICVPDHLR